MNPNSTQPQLPELPHRLTMEERRHLELTGVREVLRFDETQVVLRTVRGILVLQGEGLKLRTLTPEQGRVVVDGTMRSLSYTGEAKQGGFLKRLLG